MDGSRFGLVETRYGHEVIVSELGSPQMQVSGGWRAGADRVAGDRLREDYSRSLSRWNGGNPWPIPFPIISKILCVGRNYAAHVRNLPYEMPTEPLILSKPPSVPAGLRRRDRSSHPQPERALRGRTRILMTALPQDEGRRKRQGIHPRLHHRQRRNRARPAELDGQWTRSKGFDTFCPSAPSSILSSIPGAASRCKPGSMASCARTAIPAT